MTEISKRLKVNLKNIRRPIKGVLSKRITRDTYGIEIPLRVFSRIKYDCNVYYAGKDKDIVITNEQQFLELLNEYEVPEKTVTFEKVEEHVSVSEPENINLDINTEESTIPEEVAILAIDIDQNTKDTVENTDNEQITEYIEKAYEEENTEQVEEIPITTRDGATTVGVRKNNKRNRR